jgi:hypothetical protein
MKKIKNDANSKCGKTISEKFPKKGNMQHKYFYISHLCKINQKKKLFNSHIIKDMLLPFFPKKHNTIDST